MQNFEASGEATHSAFLFQPSSVRGAMRVSEMARNLGITPRALRYYEEQGLVSVERSQGGIRLYGPQAREQLKLIVLMRRANIPLGSIRKALNSDASVHKDLLLQRLAVLDLEREALLETLSVYR